jgi:hypothetical protein
MAGGLWSQVNIDVWAIFGRPGQLALSALGLGVCGFMVLLLARLVRRYPVARFWALGATLALVPVAAAFPMNRLLLAAGIGVFGLLAMLAGDVGLLGLETTDRRRWTRWSAKTLLALHGPVAILMLVAGILFLPAFNSLFTAGARLAPRDSALPDQCLIFVNGHEFPCAYTYIIRRIDDDAAPNRVAILGPMTSDSIVTRRDERTLEISTRNGWFQNSLDRLMRTADSRFEIGQHIRTADFDATIIRITDEGRPRTVAFEFAENLETGPYRFVSWRRGGLASWPILQVGETSVLVANPLYTLD